MNQNQCKDVAKRKIEQSSQNKSGHEASNSKKAKPCCFLCEKQRDSKGCFELSLLSSDNRQQSVRNKALELGVRKLLELIRNKDGNFIDLVEKGFKYHRSCMTEFLLRKPEEIITNKYNEAFDEFVKDIDCDLFNNIKVFYLNDLTKKFNSYLKPKYIDTAYKSHRLKNKLVQVYGDKIRFLDQKGFPTIVCSANIQIRDLIDAIISDKNEIEGYIFHRSEAKKEETESATPQTAISQSQLQSCAKYLRNEIISHAKKVSDQKSVDKSFELTTEEASSRIPISLYNHLAWMKYEEEFDLNEEGRLKLNKEQNDDVILLGQDIMSSLTKVPMPKHVGIAMYIQRECRSKNVITILNRLGCCISYNSLQRYLTTVANKTNEIEENEGIFIPTNLQKNVFFQCALDNLDFKNDCNSGQSFHCTTNVIYQYEAQSSTKKITSKIPVKKGRDVTVSNPSHVEIIKSGLTREDKVIARSFSNVKNPKLNLGLTPGALTSVANLDDQNIVWMLLRLYPSKTPNEIEELTPQPSWSEFHERIRLDCPKEKTNISYGPLIPESPTNPDVVLTSLKYFLSLSEKLNQTTTVITCDQNIYDTIKAIQMKHPQEYKSVVIRLGGFHIALNFLQCIGYLFRGSGFQDILVNNNICGRGTANKIVSGKDYYKMVHFFSLVGEAVFRMEWQAFEEWLAENGEDLRVVSLKSMIKRFVEEEENNQAEPGKMDCILDELRLLQSHWDQFLSDLSPTGKYWNMFSEMVLVLKRYLEAERGGDWHGHLRETRNMLPYMICCGHHNYAQAVPIYLSDMESLPVTHPSVHSEFVNGNFCVRATSGAFNGVWTDLALEQSYNKDGKTILFKGITDNEKTKDKYIKTAPFLAQVSESVKNMANMDRNSSCNHHHNDTKKSSATDYQMVNQLVQYLGSLTINPFKNNSENLLNIVTGEILEDQELLTAREKGMQVLNEAVERKEGKITSFKVKNFEKPKERKVKKSQKFLKEECNVTKQLLLFQNFPENRKKEMFAFEWLQYPSSLFERGDKNDVVMRKGNKSDFMNYLKTQAPNSEFLRIPLSENASVFIIDAMYFIQVYQDMRAKTFGELQEIYLNKILKLKPNDCLNVHFVGDRYDFPPDKSLKQSERDRRSKVSVSPTFEILSEAVIPPWQLFIKNNQNKANLLNYLSEMWISKPETIPLNVSLTLGGTFKDRATCYEISNGTTTKIKELECNEHEEADTRIFAHLNFALKLQGLTKGIVFTSDTDIAIIAILQFPALQHMKEIWLQKANQCTAIHILLSKLLEKVNETNEVTIQELVNTIAIVYILTGNDQTSYPFRRGKKRAAKIALQLVGRMGTITQFDGKNCNLTDSLVEDARRCFVYLYGREDDIKTLDELRYLLFLKSKCDIRSLPPTEDAFKFHLLRSLMCYIQYKNAIDSNMTIPKPENFGWQLVNHRLLPILMGNPPLPSFKKK